MSYDRKCYDLAEHFLAPTVEPRVTSALAQAIQTYIEAWLEYELRVDKNLKGEAK